jgi:hypothetical protein
MGAAAGYRAAPPWLLLLSVLCGGSAHSSSATAASPRQRAVSGQQRLEMLTHWDHSFPRGDQFPETHLTAKKYNPLAGTADGARTWTPQYPDEYVYRSVKVELEPVCNWQWNEETGLYATRSECSDGNRTDVRVRTQIKYENQYGKRSSGLRCLGDSPDATEAPEVWNGERDKEPNLRPFVLKVEDGDGTALKYTMHRSDQHWWLAYDFAGPLEGRKFYDVTIEYQLQRVMQGTPSGNYFTAPWLRDWNAPVKEMEIVWIFPPGFFVDSFDVTPPNLVGEGRIGGSEGEMRRITRACCGEEIKQEGGGVKSVEEIERCTSSAYLASTWQTLKYGCEDKSVMLSTLFSIPETELEPYGAYDDNVLRGWDTEYKVSFTPGLVNDPWAAAVGDRDNWEVPLGMPWWGWVVLVLACMPVLAALFYTLAAYGAPDFFLSQSAYKTKLQGKV